MPCACYDKKACQQRKEVWQEAPMTARPGTSTIPYAGKGLFADRDYKRGEFITYYSGTYSDNPALEGDRVLAITARISVNGSGKCRMKACRGDLINHSEDASQRNCAYRLLDSKLYIVGMVATRSVRCGQEFLTNYGPYFSFGK